MLSIRALLFLGFLSAFAVPAVAQNQLEAFRYVLHINNEYINDHSLIRGPDSLWHLFFISGVVSQGEEKWYRDGNEVAIGHYSSPDLYQWRPEMPAITIGKPGSIDAGHVYAPFVIEREGTYYMFYTATATSHFSAERICMATSKDLITWEKWPNNPVFLTDVRWAAYYPATHAGGYGPVSCRDPHILYDSAYGYIMYYVAQLRSDTGSAVFACIAAATSDDLIHWTDRGPVLIRKIQGTDEFSWAHPESPCVIKRMGGYFLFWKGGNGMRYAIGVDPLDFRFNDAYFLAPSHASEIFEWDGQWYITSCSRDLLDITHQADRKKGLYIAGLEWKERWPMIVPAPTPAPVEDVATFAIGRESSEVRVVIFGERGDILQNDARIEILVDPRGYRKVAVDVRDLPPARYSFRVYEGERWNQFWVTVQ